MSNKIWTNIRLVSLHFEEYVAKIWKMTYLTLLKYSLKWLDRDSEADGGKFISSLSTDTYISAERQSDKQINRKT